MISENFSSFFKKATDCHPYPYQVQLASMTESPSGIINIPTGMGKTAGIVLSWLWRRRFHDDPEVRKSTPRRLVYCLPMRVLVDQTTGTTAR
jgi:CRISPR-associated endonuclease/helicase Cas3